MLLFEEECEAKKTNMEVREGENGGDGGGDECVAFVLPAAHTTSVMFWHLLFRSLPVKVLWMCWMFCGVMDHLLLSMIHDGLFQSYFIY
jgi:hypothetical protein